MARDLVEVLHESAISLRLVESLVQTFGPIDGSDLNCPPGDIPAGGTRLDQLSSVHHKPFSPRGGGLLTIGNIVTHFVGRRKSSVKVGDIGIRDSGGSQRTFLSPGGNVGVETRILPVERLDLIDSLIEFSSCVLLSPQSKLDGNNTVIRALVVPLFLQLFNRIMNCLSDSLLGQDKGEAEES